MRFCPFRSIIRKSTSCFALQGELAADRYSPCTEETLSLAVRSLLRFGELTESDKCTRFHVQARARKWRNSYDSKIIAYNPFGLLMFTVETIRTLLNFTVELSRDMVSGQFRLTSEACSRDLIG